MRLALVAVFAVVGLAGCVERPFDERKMSVVATKEGVIKDNLVVLKEVKFYQAGIRGQHWGLQFGDTNGSIVELGTKFLPWSSVDFVSIEEYRSEASSPERALQKIQK